MELILIFEVVHTFAVDTTHELNKVVTYDKITCVLIGPLLHSICLMHRDEL